MAKNNFVAEVTFNINSGSFKPKWKLLEAVPIKVKQEESAW